MKMIYDLHNNEATRSATFQKKLIAKQILQSKTEYYQLFFEKTRELYYRHESHTELRLISYLEVSISVPLSHYKESQSIQQVIKQHMSRVAHQTAFRSSQKKKIVETAVKLKHHS
jgi:hypothetical protein